MQCLLRFATSAVCVALLVACASYNTARPSEPVYSPRGGGNHVAYGQVRSIETLGSSADAPRGGGAVVGGIVGAVIGRQFADGTRGKNIGTAVGAVGGAIVGNEMEKQTQRDAAVVRVTVQLDGGGARSFDLRSLGDLRVGDRVRIEGNQLYRL